MEKHIKLRLHGVKLLRKRCRQRKMGFVFARKNSRGRNKKRKLLRKGHLEMPLKSLLKILSGKQIRPIIKNKLLENVHFIVTREQF